MAKILMSTQFLAMGIMNYEKVIYVDKLDQGALMLNGKEAINADKIEPRAFMLKPKLPINVDYNAYPQFLSTLFDFVFQC